MAPRVVVAGSANMDLVGLAPALPRPGETVLGDDFVMAPGGKGSNQAIAAARAGGATTFLGAIGSDAFGVTLGARLAAAGVDTGRVRTSYGASGVAVIMVDRAGENSILVSPGANRTFTGLTADEQSVIAGADVLLCQQEIPMETVHAALRAGRAGGTRTILNAAPARDLPAGLLDEVDLLVVNEIEARAITGTEVHDPAGMAALLALVPRVVLTLSGSGARFADRDGRDVHVPAFAVPVADTTAAGDAFTGALAVAWGEGRDLVDAVRWANAAGAVCVQRVGASTALPERAEIDRLYASGAS
ncbi:putative PfkB-family carbohydrate kinase [Actinoplanes missouriensis 431]|uniref:Ribokinase n=1 Tax=Actinoplanes missouriensis (strain ATCC 14538 / DSM 43046 / CBS 188.64 / JCM 3121 / NBRC 102363 / NCIMB 12654 / NRRL B-3342 / UNCC 431) TaxID=512565 RepID=I0HH88_ACTM4|nr:ribokinase [Actinoplanes missouriensis]BAL92375.1 putative PfkB-family carbohydrate kinase [Actinoplanes missouriensis 431]